MIALVDARFHAITPDFRGYGLSDQPSEIENGGFVDLVEDLLDFLDAFGARKGFVIFLCFDDEVVVRNIYTLFSRSELPMAEEGKEIMDLYNPSTPFPPWFIEDDLKTYSSLYERSGFSFPLQVPYMAMT
ncbi:hypothetical protein KI387_004758, partial [Taxus chinensis]